MSTSPHVPTQPTNGPRHSDETADTSALQQQRALKEILDILRTAHAPAPDKEAAGYSASDTRPCPELHEEALDLRLLLANPFDNELVKRLGVHGILELLHDVGGCWKHVVSIRHIAEAEIRKNISVFFTTVGLSPNCVLLARRYQILIVGYSKDQGKGIFATWTAFVIHYTGLSNLTAKLSFNRPLVETTCAQTALALSRMPVMIDGTVFKADTQALCPAKAPRCSATDATRPATSTRSASSSSSDMGVLQLRREPRSLGSSVQGQTISDRARQGQLPSQNGFSDNASTSSNPSSSNPPGAEKNQAAPKKPRGRPPKSKQGCKDPRQTSILQFHAHVNLFPPRTSGDTDRAGVQPGASQESPEAQGHQGKGKGKAVAVPDPGMGMDMDTSTVSDTDMVDVEIVDSRESAGSQTQGPGSGSDTPNGGKRNRNKKRKGKKKAQDGEKDKPAAKAKELKSQAPNGESSKKKKKNTGGGGSGNKNKNNRNNANNANNANKQKRKKGKGKDNQDAGRRARETGVDAASQSNMAASKDNVLPNSDSSDKVDEVVQEALAPGGKAGPWKSKSKSKLYHGRGQRIGADAGTDTPSGSDFPVCEGQGDYSMSEREVLWETTGDMDEGISSFW
ncbi:hypothetical protein ACHAPT_013230 [Fusarium lateritium]